MISIESHKHFAWEILIEPRYLAQQPPTTIYLGHLDELHCVSTAAVTCGSDALENQHSTYLRSTEQDALFKQPQNSSPNRKCDAYRRRVKQGCSQDFSKGEGDTRCQSKVTYQIFMSFLQPVVGCLLKTWLTKGGGSRAPQDPPGYAPVKTSESLKCQLTSCAENQNTECQSKYNKGIRPG